MIFTLLDIRYRPIDAEYGFDLCKLDTEKESYPLLALHYDNAQWYFSAGFFFNLT